MHPSHMKAQSKLVLVVLLLSLTNCDLHQRLSARIHQKVECAKNCVYITGNFSQQHASWFILASAKILNLSNDRKSLKVITCTIIY